MLDPASAANAEIYALSITFDPRSCAVRCSLFWYAACQIKLSIFILGLDHYSSDVLFRSRLCENSNVQLACRISVSISSMRKPIAPATTVGRRRLRKQFCASLARARFHTASVTSGSRTLRTARKGWRVRSKFPDLDKSMGSPRATEAFRLRAERDYSSDITVL